MTWNAAKLTCRDLQAELISFRNQNLVPAIYAATDKKAAAGTIQKYSAWTSARANDSSGRS